MEKGYGFGAEGDWKVAAMVRMMKLMTADIKDAKGTSLMEDYTYNLVPGKEGILQAHMRHYRMIVILCKEFLDTDLLLCLHCHMPSEFVGIPAVVDDLISAVILFHQRIHFALRNRIHIFHHIIGTPFRRRRCGFWA